MDFFDRVWPFTESAEGIFNQKIAADQNRLRILGLIARRKCLSQRQLATTTGLQASTVSNIVRDLKGLGIIREGEAIEAERVGPKEMTLEVVAGVAWSVGLRLIDTGHRLIIVNALGHVLASETIPPGLSIDELLEVIPTRVHHLACRLGLDRSKLGGLGVSVPGVIDSENGMVLVSRSLHLASYPLREALQTALGTPVWIERDVACGAYVEHHTGIARDRESFVYLLIRSAPGRADTFGMALVIEEKIFRGCNSAAGEIDPNLLSNCAFQGGLSARDTSERVDHFYVSCAASIASITNLLDIRCIVLCTDDAGLTQKRFQMLSETVQSLLVPVPNRQIDLLRSMQGDEGIVLGGALLALHRHLANEFERRRKGARQNRATQESSERLTA